ncbi:MAG: ligase-associated DNA damage response endonuclease PdeM [Chitinophagaceae bacterium]|nr:MAG: ligase-associated DNA damage response endonuclease PdeM [Chitinophagaceae bacterium]
MQPPLLHTHLGQRLWLSAQRALFWEEERILLLSDLHLGKSGHFRKAGIPVPAGVMKEDMQRLLHLLGHFRPERLVVVGDLFHSRDNREHDLFRRWRDDLPDQRITLVRGNHDILSKDWYREAGIEVVEEPMRIGPYCFAHDPADAPAGVYTFCGHLHPGVVLHGLGRQSLRFPCFYFAPEYCILPAFGKFTGLANVHPQKTDIVFAVVEQSVIRMRS